MKQLVIVAGAPGTGKTTLARRLSKTVDMPLLARDTIKEALFDTIGAVDRQSSRALGRASYGVLYAAARQLLHAGGSLILESNFSRGLSEAELGRLTSDREAVLILCQASQDIIISRIRTRQDRHSQHFDEDALSEVMSALADGRHKSLDLGIPTLIVDTTDDYKPDFDAIVAFCGTQVIAS